jgi:glycerol-3-phosphate dehydrogenase (NAD(P)+)
VLVQAAKAAGVEMPISEAVASLLAGKVGVKAAVETLLARPLKEEAV